MKVSLDYDTARVYVPGSDKYVTFKLTGLKDSFLTSTRTPMQAALRGVRVIAIMPNELLSEEKPSKEEPNEARPVPETYENQAKAFGITSEEFYEARNAAKDALLTSFRSRK